MLLVGLTWGVLAFALALLLARIVRMADLRQAEDALFSFLEEDLHSSVPRDHASAPCTGASRRRGPMAGYCARGRAARSGAVDPGGRLVAPRAGSSVTARRRSRRHRL